MLIDLEIMLARAFGWSLRDIDETDVSSLLAFVRRFNETHAGAAGERPPRRAYADEVDWL